MDRHAECNLTYAGTSSSAGARETLPFHAAVALYTACVVAVSVWYGHDWSFVEQLYFERFGTVYLFTMPLFSAVIIMAARTYTRRSRYGDVLVALSPPDRLHFASGLLMLFSLVVMMGSFTTFKTLMPEIRGGFPYDRLQADLDLLLHFGYDPGPALAALPMSDWLRRLQGWNYSVLWSIQAFLPAYFIATTKIGAGIRLRYFLCFFAVWIGIGNLLALFFLSAGPAFYGDVTGDTDRFATVLDFVRQSGRGFGSPAAFQAYLWEIQRSGHSALGSGISAFPSVHVAMTMMNALFLREFSRSAGWLAFAYVGVILVSSVWLGWHYAIDGYTSIIVVILIHAGLRRMFRAGARHGLRGAPSMRQPLP